MRLCPICHAPTAPTAANVLAPMVESFCYLLIWNTCCQATVSVVLWESEE
jgi:hypothetical protein